MSGVHIAGQTRRNNFSGVASVPEPDRVYFVRLAGLWKAMRLISSVRHLLIHILLEIEELLLGVCTTEK